MSRAAQSPYRTPTLTPPVACAANGMSATDAREAVPRERKRAPDDDAATAAAAADDEAGRADASPPRKRRRARGSAAVDGAEEEEEGSGDGRQAVLLLHAAQQRYVYTTDHAIPRVRGEREMLVKVQAIGLNPIDWKAPDYGFALPDLPCIGGRDFAGVIVRAPSATSRFHIGDRILGVSTDYRDSRKSAYQEYAISSDFNACRLPAHLSSTAAAPLGVAFVAAALALGICLGVDFGAGPGAVGGPDVKRMLASMDAAAWPRDVRDECVEGIGVEERPAAGDWIAIWGGASATGCCAAQLAKLAGLRVICVLDVARSGERLLKRGADLLVDRHDAARAVAIIRGVTQGQLRHGLDTSGRDGAAWLAGALAPGAGTARAHLAALSGAPREAAPGVAYHHVPMKVFHAAPALGESLMVWLERLLARGLLLPPDMVTDGRGLAGINEALDRLRQGEVNGPRIVVPL